MYKISKNTVGTRTNKIVATNPRSLTSIKWQPLGSFQDGQLLGYHHLAYSCTNTIASFQEIISQIIWVS